MDEKHANEFKEVIGVYWDTNKFFVPQWSHIQFTMVKYKSKWDIYEIHNGSFILFKWYDKEKVENELQKWCQEHWWVADVKYKVWWDEDENF